MKKKTKVAIAIILVLIIALVSVFWIYKNKESVETSDEKELTEQNKIDKEKEENGEGNAENAENDDEAASNGDNNVEGDKGEEPIYTNTYTPVYGVEISDTNVTSDLSINKDMAKIAEKLGFELYSLDFYLNISSNDITDYQTAYDFLRAINLYLAANDVSPMDKIKLRNQFELIQTNFLNLKYGRNTTSLKYDYREFNMAGNKVEKENEMDSYEYLIGGEMIPTRFLYPTEIAMDKGILFERDEKFEEIAPTNIEEAWNLFMYKSNQYKDTLNEVQKSDLSMIINLMNEYNKTFENGDYEGYARLLFKDIREAIAPYKMGQIKNGILVSQNEFTINYIDEKKGYAIGYMLEATAYTRELEESAKQGGANANELYKIGIERVMFREDIEGNWKIYGFVSTDYIN